MSVPSVVDDEPRRRDDPGLLKDGVNQREVRSAELVCEKPVDIECVREDDAIGFAVIETSLGNDDTISDDVIDEQLFRGDGVVRGLLTPAADPSAVADGVCDVRVTDPTYADVFNYYTHLDGQAENVS
jgi:hypothetical protein